jgi:hypothetical protein
MCGLCQSRYAREVLCDGWPDVDTSGDVEDTGATFELHGSYEQVILVSALRWCIGSGTHLEQACHDAIAGFIDDIAPSTASLLAREIREWWCDFVWVDGRMSGLTDMGHDGRLDWSDLLQSLDLRASASANASAYVVRPPSVSSCDGRMVTWDDFPESMRPSQVHSSDVVDDESCVVRVRGVSEQLVVVAAVLYCFGRSSYMPGLTADVVRRHLDGLEPSVARLVARLIREWWCSSYGFDWPRVSDELSFDTVSCWLNILPALDAHAGGATLPRVKGIDSWSDVEEVVRPAACFV